MRKKILYIVLLTMVVLTACGKTEEKKEPPKTEQTDKQEDSTESSEAKGEDSQSTPDAPNDAEVKEPSNQTESNENQSNKNETTTKPSTGNTDSNKKPSTESTTKPSTGSTNNSGNTGNKQNNSTSTTTQPSTPAHTHSWTEVKETVVVQEAWVEDVFGWRTICGKCGLDMTEMTGEELIIHCSFECNSRYSAEYIKIDEIQHPAVTEEQVTGYKCECGAEK